MKTLFNNYLNTFKGLSKEVWWLALITLINRAGTMVIPFLSIYLTEDLNLSLEKVAWVMTCFGLGSVIGTWLGGKLTDTIGFYKVMVVSLFFTGILFIAVQFLKTFESFCLGIFLLMVVADTFRPAMFVAMSTYSKPKNKTRSVTLIRLAINLGFSAGPAVGGLIISGIGYSGLFWVDGLTCIAATLLLIKVLNPKKAIVQDEIKIENPESAYKNKSFIIFFFAMLVFAVIFFQYFSAMPLYYKDVHLLNTVEIGLLLGANGFFIFLFEMPLISWLEKTKYNKVSLVLFGAFLTGLSFIVLNITAWSGILIIGMFLMTVGEMIAFPFSNSYVMDLAKKGNQGEYMAMYIMSFSIASVFGFNAGLQIVSGIGFNSTWLVMTALAGICILLLFVLKLYMKKKINSNELKPSYNSH
ncbi:MFS transporter [Lacinutrix sp. 5H-3-7-4]|uniref:MFS transporter n=1 Tax=Lacinutrix sp. (strain 5H-3-7-4) TaxID=983544 RepID=UPI00020A3A00|nr:MFS transporter [Lacinutrix sp. 5H-3-7-4]AEH00120.1 major facilitator superfamily MFS_1 [Lacinutrix sp. 5H-3-7-4]